MTLEEFLAELETHVPKGAWFTIGKGIIRAHKSDSHPACCPITALAYWRDGEWFPVQAYATAGDYLGLPVGTSEAIASAADGFDEAVADIRASLLRVSGLSQ